MLLKVNCQRFAYKLRLSNLAPLLLIHRHGKAAGRGEGSLRTGLLVPVRCFASLPRTYVKAFLDVLSKPHFYIHLTESKARTSNENPAAQRSTHSSEMHSPLPHKQKVYSGFPKGFLLNLGGLFML